MIVFGSAASVTVLWVTIREVFPVATDPKNDVALSRAMTQRVPTEGAVSARTETTKGIQTGKPGVSAEEFWHTTSTRERIECLVLDREGNLFAGIWRKGVFRSTDWGTTWIPCNTGLSSIEVGTLCIDSTGGIIAGTWGKGVFRSGDHGHSWNRCSVPKNYVILVKTSPIGELFCITGDATFSSTDLGKSWVKRANTSFHWLEFGPNKEVFAMTESGNFFSLRGKEEHWRQINPPGYADAGFFVNPLGEVFLTVVHVGSPWCYRSGDSGITWSFVDSLDRSISPPVFLTRYGNMIAQHWGSVHVSTDGGTSWNIVVSGTLNYSSDNSIVLGPDGLILLGRADGLFKGRLPEGI